MSGREVVRIAFLPLTDAAAVVACAAAGFGEAEGLSVELSRENSWASLRDKLAVGLVDAAHVLAPLAMATHLGIGHLRKPLVAPVRLSLDGNIVCLSRDMFHAAAATGYGGGSTGLAGALARIAADRRASGARPLTLGTVFPASSHHALMRRIFAEAGLVEGQDAHLVVLAPSMMVEALDRAVIDGFCAGAPWGGIAVDKGLGHIAATSSEFASGRTEKLLATTVEWAEARPDALARLIRAVTKAAAWCADPSNHSALAALLAEHRHLGLPEAAIARSLDGRLVRHPGGEPSLVPRFISLGGASVSRPDPAHVGQILDEIGEPIAAAAAREASTLVSPNLYDAALARDA